MSLRFLLTLGLILRLFLLLVSAWHPDVGNHLDWGNKFWQYGPKDFYQQNIWAVSWPNQPIGSIYLFALLSKANNFIFRSFWYLNTHYPLFPSKLIPILEANLHVWLVKLPFIVADIFLAYLLFRLKPSLSLVSLYLFNPAIIYNSTIWGQTDSLINLLALAGIFLFYHRRYSAGIFLFSLSFLFKISLLFYLPIFLWLLYLYRRDWAKYLPPLMLTLLFIVLITLPFSRSQNPIYWLTHLYRDLVFNRQGQMLNGNAFNLWAIIFGIDLSLKATLATAVIGKAIFFIFIIPVCLRFIRQKLSLANLTAVLTLISFSAFMFLTNMHERYLYPIFPLLSLLFGFKFITLPTLLLLTLIHLLNLYNLWFYPLILPLKFILETNHFLLPRLLSIILIALYLKIYIKYLKSD